MVGRRSNMSSRTARRERILTELEQRNVIHLREIASLLGCSLSTARRDIAALAPLDHVQLTRGGAVWRGHPGGQSTAAGWTLADEKQRIAHAAVELVHD